MAHEFVIKNGFISKGDSIVSGSLSGETLNLTNSLFLNNLETQVLVRNNTTGLVEYRDASTFSGGSGTNTFVTGFTYNDNNTFTISDNAGSAFTATINQVSGLTTTNFIDYANTSDPSAVSGRTYYDISENALSYFPQTPMMDVTINIGQESVTRIYNNTGVQINNGQACHFNGSFSGCITVDLAIASGVTSVMDTTYEVSGIATHDIPNGTEGFITNLGLVRDLTITGTSVGSPIYLSDTIAGELMFSVPTTNSSRISQIGYVVSTGVTTGKIIVEISNESTTGVLSAKEIDVISQNNSSTTLRSGGVITVNGGNPALFDVAAGTGTIVDNTTDPNDPTLTEVSWGVLTGNSLTNLTGDSATFISINSSGNVIQNGTLSPPSGTDKRDKIFLGLVGHASRTVVNNIFNFPIHALNPINQLADLTSSIGPFSTSGNVVAGIGGTLELQKSVGSSYFYGGNFQVDNTNPDIITTTNLSGATLIYAKGTDVLGPSGTTVDTQNYDPDGLGTITPLSIPNDVTTARIWHNPTANILVFQYGQQTYTTRAEARDSFGTESYVAPAPLTDVAYLLAVLITDSSSDGSDLDDAVFIPQGKFAGSGGGGGGSVDTLQTAYNNSNPNPEILTDGSGGPVDFRVGSGSDSDNLIRFQQNNGTVNAFITGEGNSSFNNISGETLQLNTVVLNPTGTDILVRNSATGVVDYRPVSGITPDLNTFVTGFTYNENNTFTISDNAGSAFTATINQVSGLTVNGILSATTYTGITLNSLDDVTTGIPVTPDNTYQGRMMYFDVATSGWTSTEEYVSTGTVTIWGKKGSAGTIDKGLPVYIVGFDDDIHEVELANSSTGTTMPVIGFTSESFDNTNTNPIVTFGKLTGINTSGGTTTLNPNGETWVINDELYVSTTTGGLTKVRPTGSDTQIQRIAKILKVGTVDGQLFVFNTARTAGLPNLTTNYLWVGDGSDTPQETIKTSVGVTVTGFTYNDNNTLTISDNDGGSFPATINQVSGLTVNGILSATTISGGTLYGDGSNLTGISTQINTGNVLWVDNIFGNDGTALVDRQDKPWSSIATAIGNAVTNDTIMVRPGDYVEPPFTLIPGTSLISQGGPKVTFISGSTTTGNFITVSGSSYMEGFTLYTPTDDSAALYFNDPTGGIVTSFHNVHFKGSSVSGGTGVTLGKGLVMDSGLGSGPPPAKIIYSELRYGGGHLNTLVEVNKGIFALDGMHVPGGQTVNKGIQANGGRAQLINVNIGNPNCNTAISVSGTASNTPVVVGFGLNLFNVPTGLEITSNYYDIELQNGRVEAGAENLLISSGLTGEFGKLNLVNFIMDSEKIDEPYTWADSEHTIFYSDIGNSQNVSPIIRTHGNLEIGQPNRGSSLSVGRGTEYQKGLHLHSSGTTGTTNLILSATTKGVIWSFESLTAGEELYIGSSERYPNGDYVNWCGFELTYTGSTGGTYTVEYYSGGTWVDITYQVTNQEFGYNYSNNLFNRTVGTREDVRIGIGDANVSNWGELSLFGHTAKWLRVTMVTPPSSLPQFDLLWVEGSHTKINQNGIPTYYGSALYRDTIITAGNIFGVDGAVTDANIDVGSTVTWTHVMENSQFNTSAMMGTEIGDAIMLQTVLPKGTCTAYPLKISLHYILVGSGPLIDLPELTISVVVKETYNNKIADPTGGIVPTKRTLSNTNDLTTNGAEQTVELGELSDFSNEYLSVTDEYEYDISSLYESDGIFIRIEFEFEGDPVQTITIPAVEASVVKWALGERLNIEL